MAARPGEENVATLFGDIHYYYGPPDAKPPHHRFDKGSYVYLFENANERRCRIEVANNAGTDDQDAFDGFLDQTRVRYSYKQHCMVSLTVADNVDQSEWHLPTYDPRNENKYHYKLHSLDIYFWTQQDALQFINGVRRVIPPSHVEVLDEPPPPPQPAPLSAVVQKLENIAISNPQYGSPNPPGNQGFAPPPIAPAPSNQSPAPASFAPIPYNPAAPAAPETIQHREKTPPPDEDPLNPLAVAVAYDYQKQPFTPGFPPQSQFPLGGLNSPGLPPQGLKSPGLPPPQFGGPPQHPGLNRAMTMPAQPALGSPYGATFPGSPGFAPPPPQQLQSQSAIPVANPHLPPPPQGGYPQHPYNAAPQPGGQDYGVHQQLYRPTQAEHGNPEMPNKGYQPKTEARGKLEENAGRLERGMTGMFKKFEKKFG
ncbi:Fc.00g004620.m01.CDS01 [Cosmosporella sp. VM-42]